VQAMLTVKAQIFYKESSQLQFSLSTRSRIPLDSGVEVENQPILQEKWDTVTHTWKLIHTNTVYFNIKGDNRMNNAIAQKSNILVA
jgi:hypothetical protein